MNIIILLIVIKLHIKLIKLCFIHIKIYLIDKIMIF